MMFTTALALSMLSAVFASPQIYGPPAGGGGGGGGASAPATTTAAASNAAPSAPPDTPGNMNIDVAFQSTFTFHPANITAPNGTIVTFWFPNAGLAHSVTQSSFEAPCTYLAASSNSSAGFSSGLVEGVQFSINITDDTTPIWFHCEQVTHCGLGMVGSINAPSSGNTFSAFQQAAMAIGSNEPVVRLIHISLTGDRAKHRKNSRKAQRLR
ncbi:hypothetical protein PLICRDRAFT_637307 [Plicaturopsis crispa FD-325 SS-3]|nr:hypothetical protein PLICRDRAFT_637307 [Plicaturopsis crispa FD-325 SS-3]